MLIRYALREHFVKRILIIDWNNVHDNSTQKLFQESQAVLFISLHRWYEYTNSNGSYKWSGEGIGEGYTINIPWNVMVLFLLTLRFL